MKTGYIQLERYGQLVAKASTMNAEEKVEAKNLQQAMREDGLTIKKVGNLVVITDEAIEATIRKFKIG